MNITKQILLLACLLVLAGMANLFFVPVTAQVGEESDASGDQSAGSQSDEDQSGNEQYIEKPVKEIAGERSLETECNEHGVEWHDWAEKVAGAVWGPLIENRAVACGQSRVHWQVTSDCRVHIISVYSPIPDGAQVIVGAIKALDHNSILAFPRDSKKTVVWRTACVGGKPIIHRIHGPIKVYP